jgi:hypothetical protein
VAGRGPIGLLGAQDAIDRFRARPGQSPSAQAERIWTLATRYAASAWRFDQDLEAMPAHYDGTPKQNLWAAFASGAAMPLGKRQLRSVLASAA